MNGQITKKTEPLGEINTPIKTKDGKGYRITVKDKDILDIWLELLTLR